MVFESKKEKKIRELPNSRTLDSRVNAIDDNIQLAIT